MEEIELIIRRGAKHGSVSVWLYKFSKVELLQI